MRYGFVLPDLDIVTAPGLAADAEAAGWDGVFIPDCISIEVPGSPALPASDPWVTLAAMALATSRVRLGPMVAAAPRRRPWKLAREVATLDHLSGGRMILPLGVGAAGDDAGFREVGEEMDLRSRATALGETLEILAGLWSGEPFGYAGQRYHIGSMQQLPTPVQRLRVPLWVVGVWPARKSMERALRWDGLVLQKKHGLLTFDDVRAIGSEVLRVRGDAPYDIIAAGSTNAGSLDAVAIVQAWSEAGATWWMEEMWSDHSIDSVRARILAGPPSS